MVLGFLIDVALFTDMPSTDTDTREKISGLSVAAHLPADRESLID